MPETRSAVCTERSEIWSSEPRIAPRSFFRPPTNCWNVVIRSLSWRLRSPDVVEHGVEVGDQLPITWSRFASVWVIDAVGDSIPSSVPPWPWKTWMIS